MPYFDVVIGSSMEHSDASKAYLMQRAMQQLHIPETQKEQVVMIGDRKFDAEVQLPADCRLLAFIMDMHQLGNWNHIHRSIWQIRFWI